MGWYNADEDMQTGCGFRWIETTKFKMWEETELEEFDEEEDEEED